MIKIKNVTKKYGAFTAVDDLTLEVKDGEIFGLLGPNGAGKSTTLKMITGLTDITKGQIIIDGFDITKDPVDAKRQFGFVLDSPDMFMRLKGYDFLIYVGKIYHTPDDKIKENIKKYSKMLKIDDALNQPIASYSHGMRQKIMIISALVHEPKTFILDEPMTGLDPISQHTIKELMHQYSRDGKAVLFSTHVLETAERLCDRVGIINKGKLVLCGSLDELKENSAQSLEDIFLEKTVNEE